MSTRVVFMGSVELTVLCVCVISFCSWMASSGGRSFIFIGPPTMIRVMLFDILFSLEPLSPLRLVAGFFHHDLTLSIVGGRSRLG